MILLIGMDDTDNLDSRGTGRLARQVADLLSIEYQVLGVVRHQLLIDPRIPYTKHNSSATILVEVGEPANTAEIFQRVKDWMLDDNPPGSDPGLCAAVNVPQAVIDFGCKAKVEVVSQEEAHRLASEHEILLEELGGTGGGVIGALAGVGLAASQDDGRYVQVGSLRELTGLQAVDQILAAGVDSLVTPDGQAVTQGRVLTDKLRPARRGGRPVAYVIWDSDYWQPLKLD